MMPDKIREMLTAACPELVWVVDGEKVRAEGLALSAGMGGCGVVLRRDDRPNVASLLGCHPASETLADGLAYILTGHEVNTCPGAARFVARRHLGDAQARVAYCKERDERAASAMTAALSKLIGAESDVQRTRRELAAAEADLAKTAAWAAKVGA
jgi:hypothetical protein